MTPSDPPVQSEQPQWNVRSTILKCMLFNVATAIAMRWLIPQIGAHWCLFYIVIAIYGSVAIQSTAAVIRLGVGEAMVFGIASALFFAFLLLLSLPPREREGGSIELFSGPAGPLLTALFILPFLVLPTLPFAFFGAAVGCRRELRRQKNEDARKQL